jgi:BirA family biotin operon repressor/biotin-[acetyl-CoA-carboxylase] ligase
MNPTAPFDLQRIRDETFVGDIDFHWELPSTNSYALRRCEPPADLNTLVTPWLILAEQQTQGRGRGKNQWWSAPGALTFSLVVRLDGIAGDRLPQIALTAGLAVCQAVEGFVPLADLALKWPNDVYLNQRKLAGILIEVPPGRPLHAVLGIGINVNNSLQEAAAELRPTSIALVDALQFELDRDDLLIACLQQLERRLDELRRKSTDLVDQWRAYHLLQGRTLEIDAYDRRLRGTCVGIDDDGALLLETPTGLQRCLGGVITAFE